MMLVNSPRISVVVATYNGERYLQAQLDSILLQTLPPKEIIVVDDCSTDGTLALLEVYAQKDGRFRIIRNAFNLGYVKNFEQGMKAADCAFIALSDQDDTWLPHKLATLYAHLGDHLLAYSDSELVDANGTQLQQRMSGVRNQLAYHSCLMYTIGAWAPGHAMMFKKELLLKCLPFSAIVTHDFWLGYVATCYSTIQYVPEPLVYYRQHNANAIGANTHTKQPGKSKPGRHEKLRQARARMQLLYNKCPVENKLEKETLWKINESYKSFSLYHNWLRMKTFFAYRNLILAYKKKSPLMKWLFCLKMFFKIE